MRLGQNPAKFVKTVVHPARVTVAVLNYIPFVSGYYEQLPKVLDACLRSIREGAADIDYDLMVFDNGSCPEVVHSCRYMFGQNTSDDAPWPLTPLTRRAPK